MAVVHATDRYGLSSHFIYSEDKLMAQDDKVWWYAKGDQKFGPYTAPELKAIAAKGTIEKTGLIWKEGLPNWIQASTVKGLIPATAPVAPPPLPAAARSSAPVSNAVKPLNQKAPITTAQTSARTTSIEPDSLPTNPALWNPSALANWSFLLTPIFGSYLAAENYKAMGEDSEAKKAMLWLYIGAAIMASFILGGILKVSSSFGAVLFLTYLAYLAAWSFLLVRKQRRAILSEFGKDYERQPWGRVLAIGIAGMFCWQLLLRLT